MPSSFTLRFVRRGTFSTLVMMGSPRHLGPWFSHDASAGARVGRARLAPDDTQLRVYVRDVRFSCSPSRGDTFLGSRVGDSQGQVALP